MLSFRYILLSGTSLSSVIPTPTLDLDFTTMTALPSTITFSRPSNATYYDSTGKLTYAPNNLLTYSQDFTNAAWVISGTVTRTSGQTDPSGGTTATKLDLGASSGIYQFAGSKVGNYVFSIWVKGDTAGTIRLSDASGGAFDVNVNVTTAWTRVDTGSRAISGFVSPYINRGTGNLATVYVAFSQLEIVTYQTTPGTYNATTSAAYYGARLDYNPATLAARGLLIEEARTNVTLYSAQFNDGSWTPSSTTITANTVTSPDGTTNADTLTAGSTGTLHSVYQTNPYTTTTANYALSLYVKKGTNRYVFISHGAGAGSYATAVFDLDGSGTSATQTGTGGSCVVVSTQQEGVGNGWFRLTLVASGTTSRYFLFGFSNAATGNSFNADGSILSTTTGTETFYIYGAQFELGSFATSYIPTAASSVARSADTASMTGTNFSSWYNQSEGTFVTASDVEGFASNPGIYRAANAAYTNYLGGYMAQSTTAMNVVVSTGQAGFNLTAATINVIQKIALAYKTDNFAAAVNGVLGTNATTGPNKIVPTDLIVLYLADLAAASAPLNGHIASLVYYPQRLPNATLQSLTAPDTAPTGNGLVWGDGNYLIWDTGNFLTWG